MSSVVRIAILFAVAVVSLSACFNFAGKKDPKSDRPLTTADIAVGMSERSFTSIFGSFTIPADGQWTRPGEVEGLRGEWTYSFYQGKLSWFVFSSLEPEVSSANFKRYLKATQKAVAAYTQRYGKPSQVVWGVLEFKDPREGYPGYPVVRAGWKTGGESLQIDYSVLGSPRDKPELQLTIETKK